MELKYKSALEKHNLSVDELPKDARIGVKEIEKVLKGKEMLEARGKKLKPETEEKIQTLDKWVYQEIMDHVKDTDENPDDPPTRADEILEEIKKQAAEPNPKGGGDNDDNQTSEVGEKIDQELYNMFESGKTEWTIDDIKSKSPNTYKIIWEGYDANQDNGVQTTHFSLIETGDQVYTLKQL